MQPAVPELLFRNDYQSTGNHLLSGHLQTDAGFGSGAAVTANVVLTAAHLVFNDDTLSYVSNAWWSFQEQAGVFQPEPQAARGWSVLVDFKKVADILPTVSGPECAFEYHGNQSSVAM